MFKVGDRVKDKEDGYIGTIIYLRPATNRVEIKRDDGVEGGGQDNTWIICPDYLIHIDKQKGGETMNNTIVKLFAKTADAVLVEKHLGGQIVDNAIEVILLEGKQEAILKEAKKLEAEATK